MTDLETSGQPPSQDLLANSGVAQSTVDAAHSDKDTRNPVNNMEVTKETDSRNVFSDKTPEVHTQGETSTKLTFTEELEQYQGLLDREFQEFDASLQSKSRNEGLSQMNWDNLQHQFEQELGKKIQEETEIMREFESRQKQFMLWMQVSHERETERAIKRLKTQSLFVQNSENRLAEKEQHYEKVMLAFQNAMRLLAQTP